MTVEWVFLQIFANAVEVGALFFLLCSKFPAKTRNVMPTVCFISGSVVFSSLRIFIPDLDSLPTTEIVVPLCCFVYLLLLRNGRIRNKLFWVIMSYTAVIAITFFSVAIVAMIGTLNASDIMMTQKPSIERLITMVISKILQISIFFLLSKKNKSSGLKDYLSVTHIIACFTVPLISFILMIFVFVLIVNGVYIPELLVSVIAIGHVTISIIVFVLYEIISREAEQKNILMIKNKQYGLINEHNKEIVRMYDSSRAWRHDYNNHMQLILSMIEKSDSEANIEAINYIKNLDDKIQSSFLELITGNSVIDAIVSAKANLASTYDIKIVHKISTPDFIYVDNTDLCAILSNLFDNAIEASSKLDENRYINFEMLTARNQLNIRITNATDGRYNVEDGKIKTTKRGDFHGIGLSNVKSIVEKYGGFYEANPEPDTYSTHISIPLRRANK